MRVGFGFDVHRLTPGRRLVLGGVEVPFPLGLLGHSDADVVSHAIADALLGAAGLGDIGHHFPTDDPRYEGISSLVLLQEVGRKLEGAWRILNVDATIVAEEPRMAPHIAEMRKRLSQALGIGGDRVNIKATTSEGLGFTGRREGIAAYAVAALERLDEGH